MSHNKNVEQKEDTSVKEGEGKKLGKKGIIAIVAAVVALAIIIVGIIILANRDKSFDYNKAKLSKYVYVPEEMYKGYNVTINIPEITDADVEEEIIKIQCANKITPEGPIYSYPNTVISAGDMVTLYYRGYTLENGVKKYFDGGCNFASEVSKTELEIGSGSFVPGFESGLIGETAEKYAQLNRLESGTVKEGDIISLTYSVVKAGGASLKDQTVLIDLSDETLDDRWGRGFTEFFIGKTIDADTQFATGNTKEDKYLIVPSVEGGKNDTDVYLDMSINVACRPTLGETLVIETRFPHDYTSADLAGKTGYFEVYIQGVRDYGTPEFNDTFITETLKFTAEDLSGYQGETLVEKYKGYIKDILNAERDAEIKYAIEDSFWAQLMACVEIKKLPESEVDRHYNSALVDITDMFEGGYNNYYADLDTFARSYLELSTSADWRAYLREDAEQSVKQRIAFYYIVQQENLRPNDEEYAEIYEYVFEEHLQEYLDYYKITESSSNYNEQVEYAKQIVAETYGQEYWDECVLYDYVIAEMISRANVIYQ